MPRYFTHYWKNSTWKNARRVSAPGEPLTHVADNKFVERGVEPGDFIYVVTVMDGELYLLGRLEVGKICDFDEAVSALGTEDLWEASDHVIVSGSTPKHFDLVVPSDVTKRLEFVSGNSTTPLKFSSLGHLDRQTLRGVRELTPGSAAELDRLLLSNSSK